jgi:hypothetical protein
MRAAVRRESLIESLMALKTGVLVGLLMLMSATLPRSSRAQSVGLAPAGVSRISSPLITGDSSNDLATRTAIALRPHLPPKRYAALVSAIVPGGGQYMLGNDRFMAYAAVELLTWFKFAKDAREKSQQETTFRDIARRVARANFSPNPPDGSWTYYEAMRDFQASGNYSLSDATLVPETDATTFNGYTWVVAQNTTPDLSSALAQYASRAAHPDFRWSWLNAQLQFDRFKRTTENRNDAARAMTRDLTIIGFNHILSLVDAFATFRLEARPQVDGGMLIGASVPW